MKRIVALFFALLIAATMPLVLGAEAKKTKRMGTPEDSVFVFGAIYDGYEIRFTQFDPEFQPAYYEHNANLYFFDNVEPGSYLKVTMFQHNGMNVTTTYYTGLQGKSTLDVRVPTKPGLYFAGFMDFSERKNSGLIFKPGDPKFKFTELKVLKWVLPALNNDVWRPTIENRIKELESEGK